MPANSSFRGRIPVAIEPDRGLNVLLLVYSLEELSKPFPLIPNESLEASTTVQQGAVEIEDHGLYFHNPGTSSLRQCSCSAYTHSR